MVDLTPTAIAQLTPARLTSLLRRLTADEVARLTVGQCLAAVSVLSPFALRDPARRGNRLSALFLTDEERRTMTGQFLVDVLALRDQLARGPTRGETMAQLADRLLRQFAWLLEERYAGLHNGLRLSAPRGRRPKFKTGPPKSVKSGRPQKFKVDNEEWFLNEIEKLRAALERKGMKPSYTGAIRLSIWRHYLKRYRAQGRSDAEAKRLAHQMANGPLLRTRKRMLWRLRARKGR